MLRTRIFLHLLPFTIILIAVVSFALFLFSRLANTVGATITQNYLSDAAVVEMWQAVERMDTALGDSYTKDKNTAQLMFDTNRRLFEEKLHSLLTNSEVLTKLPDLLQVQTNFATLQALGTAIFSSDLNREGMKKRHGDTVPVKNTLDLLLNGKEGVRERIRNNIFATSQTIQNVTRTITSLLILGLAVGLTIYAYTSFRLGQAILTPIQAMTHAAREIGEGKLDLTIPVLSHDELGELASTFNKMAAQLNVYRQGVNEQIVRLHHTMEAALASFSDPVYILDPGGRIELKNRAAEELSRQLAFEGGLPPKLAAAATDVLRLNKDFVPDSFSEVLTLRVNGGEKSFLPRIHLMRDPAGRPVGAAVALHDVTRFRLLDDAKTNLVATVSHELKTPLTSVRMVLHMLLEKSLGPLTSRQNELIQTARRDSERLLRILDALLDIARLETGASSLVLELVQPGELVQAIAEEARHNANPQGFKIMTDVQPNLPAVAVDRQQIGHVFHNFITNSIKYSPPGAPVLISALADVDHSGVVFSVRDQGAGIAEEFQGRLFERFYRVPGHAQKGVGLGLSIAREIIVAHGGRVGVRSQLGKGSEFFFVLEAMEKSG